MTDEEMAKEYCNNEVPFDTTDSGEKLYTENDLKHAYLVGLKAGKPKWHKVADGDLPEYRYYVLVSRGTRTDKALYNKYEEKWYSYYDDDELDNVTAWCEIPKFEE